MLSSVVSYPNRSSPTAAAGMRRLVAMIFVLWLALAFWLGARGIFVTQRGTPPILLLLAVLIPIGAFVLGWWVSRPFRDFLLAADLRMLTAMQAWRFAGVGFIALHTHGLLPGYFAWPAGLGDVVVGVTAPWMAIALSRGSGFAGSRTFVAWTLFGIFDFAVLAVGMGAIARLLFPGLAQTVTPQMAAAAPMRHLPLVLVPTFAVPMFTIFHFVALLQVQALKRGNRDQKSEVS